MKVIFWNTARGSKFMSEQLDKVMENCIALAHGKPEMIVLCEGQKGTRKQIRAKGGLPGYTLIKPAKVLGNYTDANTLRYVIFARDDAKCVAHYVGTSADRPAVHITLNNVPMMAIHAPSVTSSTTPQTTALRNAMSTPLASPAILFGDLNVDADNPQMRKRFIEKVSYEFNNLTGGTKKLLPKYDLNNYTRPGSEKSLDWAMVDPAFNSAVKVSVMQNKNTTGKKSKDWEDDDFEPEIMSTGKSDHEAILIEIT